MPLLLNASPPRPDVTDGDASREAGGSFVSRHPVATLAGLGALAAGLGGYRYFRTPQFAKNNPALARLQRIGAEKGFHRVVDVTHDPAEKTRTFLDRLQGLVKVRADETGKLDRWNRLKLWALEGGDAIPVVAKDGKTYVVNPDNTLSRNKKIRGLVYGRQETKGVDGNIGDEARRAIRGGYDAEGDARVRSVMTQLGMAGKDTEARLLGRYAPDVIPDTEPTIARLMRNARGKGGARDLKTLRAAVEARFGDRPFLLKPTITAQSSGAFPFSGNSPSKAMSLKDWQKRHKAYLEHLKNPGNRAAFQKAKREGYVQRTTYLRQHGIHEGYVLDEALRHPSRVLAQEEIVNPIGEWRVHVNAGSAPEGMMMPRHAANSIPALVKNRLGIGTQGVSAKAMREFVEGAVTKLPKEYRKGSFGMDVMPFKRPDGTVGYKIVELNPAETAGMHGSEGGSSGLITSDHLPTMGHAHYKQMTGRDTNPMAIAKGLGVAGATGVGIAGLGAALTRKKKKDDAPGYGAPSPVGVENTPYPQLGSLPDQYGVTVPAR